MKDAYVSALVEGRVVDAVFALESRELRSARTGDAYLAVELADRTGSIRGVLFRPRAEVQAIPAGTVVRARGRVTTFRGRRRISLDDLKPVDRYDPADLIPAGSRDPDELLVDFERLRSQVRRASLAAVLDEVFEAPAFLESFAVCPGSRQGHHAHAGGLLEHTVSVAEIARHAGACYGRVDDDLLLTCSLLHDVGKVDELEFDVSIGYSDAGRMLGHVVLGERRVAEAVSRLGSLVPHDVALRLSHVLLAHHGHREWGAPTRPCVLEAVVLHHADMLDADVADFASAVSGAAVVQEQWTPSSNAFRRPLLVPRSDVRVSA